MNPWIAHRRAVLAREARIAQRDATIAGSLKLAKELTALWDKLNPLAALTSEELRETRSRLQRTTRALQHHFDAWEQDESAVARACILVRERQAEAEAAGPQAANEWFETIETARAVLGEEAEAYHAY